MIANSILIPKFRKVEGSLSRELSDKLNMSGEEGDVDNALKLVGDIDVKNTGAVAVVANVRDGRVGGMKFLSYEGQTSRATWPPRRFSPEETRMSPSRSG